MRQDGAVHVVAESVDHGARLFGRHDGLVRKAAARAAIGLGHADAKQPHAAGLVPDIAIGVLLLAPLFLVGREFFFEQAACGILE
ncbi:hypothetical protein D3C73_1029300 [compost metagenome]